MCIIADKITSVRESLEGHKGKVTMYLIKPCRVPTYEEGEGVNINLFSFLDSR